MIKNKPTKKKQNLAQKMRANPAFKWWAVPPKKGPLSQGLKLGKKQVKKAQENIYGRNRQSSPER